MIYNDVVVTVTEIWLFEWGVVDHELQLCGSDNYRNVVVYMGGRLNISYNDVAVTVTEMLLLVLGGG